MTSDEQLHFNRVEQAQCLCGGNDLYKTMQKAKLTVNQACTTVKKKKKKLKIQICIIHNSNSEKRKYNHIVKCYFNSWIDFVTTSSQLFTVNLKWVCRIIKQMFKVYRSHNCCWAIAKGCNVDWLQYKLPLLTKHPVIKCNNYAVLSHVCCWILIP